MTLPNSPDCAIKAHQKDTIGYKHTLLSEKLLQRGKLSTLHMRPRTVSHFNNDVYKVKNGLAPPYIADLSVVTS